MPPQDLEMAEASGSDPNEHVDEEPEVYEEVEDYFIYEYLKPKNKKKRSEKAKDVEISKPRPIEELIPIYKYEDECVEENLYIYDDDKCGEKTIYEKKDGKGPEDTDIYSKGKERNNQTSIPPSEKQEHIGRYLDEDLDYSMDESPYSQVMLEEIITEGKPTETVSEKTKKKIKEDTVAEEIQWDDE